MNIPPGSETTRREARELAARFSALSTEISACLDAVLGELQRAPNNARALGVARELVSAQRSVTQQLMMLSHTGGLDGPQQLLYADPRPQQLLPAPDYANPAAPVDVVAPRDTYSGGDAAGSLLHLLQRHAAPTQDVWQAEPIASHALRPQPATLRSPMAYEPLQPQPIPLQPRANWNTPTAAPVPQAFARAAHAPRYSAPPPAAEFYADDAPDDDLASEPSAPTGRPRRASPLAIATRLGSARRSSPMRLAAVVVPMIVVLMLMLNAGPRVSKPVPPIPEASVETAAAGDKKFNRNARAPVQEVQQAEADTQSTGEQQFEAGSAQAAEVASYHPPASAQPIAGTITTVLPPPPAQLQQDAAAPPRERAVRISPPAAARTPEPSDDVGIPAPPTARAKPVNDAAKTAMLTPQQAAKPSPAQAKPAAADLAKPPAAKIAPFKTAVVEAAPSELFVPVLLELKSESSLRQIFQDLQKRYPAGLGTKHAELRPVAGPQNEKWFALLAAPGVTRADADGVCQALGQEGKSLGCRVMRY